MAGETTDPAFHGGDVRRQSPLAAAWSPPRRAATAPAARPIERSRRALDRRTPQNPIVDPKTTLAHSAVGTGAVPGLMEFTITLEINAHAIGLRRPRKSSRRKTLQEQPPADKPGLRAGLPLYATGGSETGSVATAQAPADWTCRNLGVSSTPISRRYAGQRGLISVDALKQAPCDHSSPARPDEPPSSKSARATADGTACLPSVVDRAQTAGAATRTTSTRDQNLVQRLLARRHRRTGRAFMVRHRTRLVDPPARKVTCTGRKSICRDLGNLGEVSALLPATAFCDPAPGRGAPGFASPTPRRRTATAARCTGPAFDVVSVADSKNCLTPSVRWSHGSIRSINRLLKWHRQHRLPSQPRPIECIAAATSC